MASSSATPRVKAPLTATNLLHVVSQLEGRDKFTKVLQYGSRALAFYILSADPKSELGLRLRTLFRVTQQSRKAFRLGKSVLYIKPIYRLLVAPSRDSELLKNDTAKPMSLWQRQLRLIHNLGLFGFMLYDNAAFLGSARVLPIDAQEAMTRGGLVWFCGNVAGFLAAVDALNADLEREQCVRNVLSSEEDPAHIEELQAQLDALQQSRLHKALNLLKVTCDLIVSANMPGVSFIETVFGKKLHDGIIGAVGCLSATIVLFNCWPTIPATVDE